MLTPTKRHRKNALPFTSMSRDGMEKIREQTRKRVAEHRKRQKELACNVTVTECNATEEDKNKKRIEEDKKENKKENKKDTPTVYYPEDELLNQAFLDYIEMRKKIKKPLATDRAIKLAMNNIEKLSGGDNDVAIQIIEQSIMNSWQGLFPLKEEKQKNNSKSVFDEWRNA